MEISFRDAVTAAPPNRGAAAAVLAAATGAFMLGVLAFAGDASRAVAHAVNVWNPTGPLSGVTAAAIIIWLVTGFVLARSGRGRALKFPPINRFALALVIAGMLLRFPPFMDLLQGR